MRKLGKRLRVLRETVDMTQKEVGELLGMSQNSIYRYEIGLSEPTVKTLRWYADYFDVSMDYIFSRTDRPQGKLYRYEPKEFREKMQDKEAWEQFVELCFDPESPMNARLKEMLMLMVEEGEE